jgi:hypothetical protein
MERGLFIMISVFLLIVVIHLISLKLIRTSEKKKKYLRTIFFYIYGVAYVIIGVMQLEPNDTGNIFPILQIAGGIIFIVLNYLGELNPTK